MVTWTILHAFGCRGLEQYKERPPTELVISALLDLLATWPKKPRVGAIQRLRSRK